MNLNDLKDDLHGLILKIGDEIYNQRVIQDQIENINASKLKFANSKRYENNERVQFKLNLLRDRYDCETEHLKYHYTEMYYRKKTRLAKLFNDGLPMMAVYLIQKLDYEMQAEYKNLIEQLRHDMEGDFKILLNCILEQRAKDYTANIQQLVEAQFEKDFATVTKVVMYCMNNIEVHVNQSICEDIVKNIHIKCAERSAAKLAQWEMRKENKTKIDEIKKYIKAIKRWRPQLTVCPNIEKGKKHFRDILKKYQKYFNFYNSSHDVWTFSEIADENADNQRTPKEHKLNTTPSTIFAAFDRKGTYCCNDESKVFVATECDVIPITKICIDQTTRQKTAELKNLKDPLPPEKFEIDWTLCETYEDDGPSAEVIKTQVEARERKDSLEIPNLLTDLLHIIDPDKLASEFLNALDIDAIGKFDTSQRSHLQRRISTFLKHEIEHNLNDQEVLNQLNSVLGPAYDAVRMKRISALSYIRDSMTILKSRPPEPNSLYIPPQIPEPTNTHTISPTILKLTHQGYLDSFKKLPPYLFPPPMLPPFDNVYEKLSESEIRHSILHTFDITAYIGDIPCCTFCELNHPTKEMDRAKHRRTSILKQNPRDKILQPYYKMTMQSLVEKLNAEDKSNEEIKPTE